MIFKHIESRKKQDGSLHQNRPVFMRCTYSVYLPVFFHIVRRLLWTDSPLSNPEPVCILFVHPGKKTAFVLSAVPCFFRTLQAEDRGAGSLKISFMTAPTNTAFTQYYRTLNWHFIFRPQFGQILLLLPIRFLCSCFLQFGNANTVQPMGRIPFFNVRITAFTELQRNDRFMSLTAFLFDTPLLIETNRRFQMILLCIYAHLVHDKG